MSLETFMASPWFILILIWSLIWKGIALWKAGRNNQLAWFICMLVINVVGFLEIIYLAFFQPKKKRKK
ncbi:hypothetical protein HYT23_04215 [Candidatus Pacearchaeota archaeon]|nr:hypothetical protein [Candidatus Pacearchaeota archaeon]